MSNSTKTNCRFIGSKLLLPASLTFLLWTTSVPSVANVENVENSVRNFDLPQNWLEIKPGGATICARGSEFSFFVSPGTSNKVVIDFIGGGACWDSNTCMEGSATFVDSIDGLREIYKQGLTGIYNRQRNDNPLQDWTHVVIPYCTGDIHWGDRTVEYQNPDGSSFTIFHKGAVNTEAVLKWVRENIVQPEKVLVTGCSAGSYGSIYWAPAIQRMFPNSLFLQLGDGGSGVATDDFFPQTTLTWNTVAHGPTWIPKLDPNRVNWGQLQLVDFYRNIGDHLKNAQFAQANSAFDVTQTFFYELMGGFSEDWSTKMFASIANIQSTTANFRSYTTAGDDHCLIPYNRFYTDRANGVYFKDWFKSFIDSQRPDSVTCVDCGPSQLGN